MGGVSAVSVLRMISSVSLSYLLILGYIEDVDSSR